MKNSNHSQSVWLALSFTLVGLILGLVVTDSDFLKGGSASVLGDDVVKEVVVVEDADPEPTGFNIDAFDFQSVSSDDDPIKGDPDAPITIVEFSDFECGYCQRFYQNTLPTIQEKYIDTGLVKLVYRDLPLSFHPSAMNAAQAAECVGLEGDEAYFEMHDLLFDNLSAWAGAADVNGTLTSLASQIGYDIASCLENGDTLDEVNLDRSAGQSYGLSGTPSFFINGRKVVGAHPFDVFEAIIEYELEQL